MATSVKSAAWKQMTSFNSQRGDPSLRERGEKDLRVSSQPQQYTLVLSKVNSLQNSHGCGGVLGGVACVDVVCMAMSAVLKESFSLLVHPRTVQQVLQLTGLSGERERGRHH